MADQAFVTLTTNDSYAKGAMVLGTSLRNQGTRRKLAVLTGPQVSQPCRAVLSRIYDEVRPVELMDSGDAAHLALMKRPELGITLTKLHCWTLTHYSKCVFMDADTLVVSNVDELFDRDELSAAPDPGWPDCFNSGVFVFRPSNETYGKLLKACEENGSFDGGDQGLLNSFFSDWATADISKHLPFTYNLSSSALYTYLPAFKQFGHNAKVVHFVGGAKPWEHLPASSGGVNWETLQHTHTQHGFLQQWWNVFSNEVLPIIKQEYGDRPLYNGSAQDGVGVEVVSRQDLRPAPPRPAPAPAPQVSSSSERRQLWEQGQADYMGADCFSNIQRKLDSFLK